jgi:hypothetical protein
MKNAHFVRQKLENRRKLVKIAKNWRKSPKIETPDFFSV